MEGWLIRAKLRRGDGSEQDGFPTIGIRGEGASGSTAEVAKL
jgi:hypothetical protein